MGSEDKRLCIYDLNGKKGAAVRPAVPPALRGAFPTVGGALGPVSPPTPCPFRPARAAVRPPQPLQVIEGRASAGEEGEGHCSAVVAVRFLPSPPTRMGAAAFALRYVTPSVFFFRFDVMLALLPFVRWTATPTSA